MMGFAARRLFQLLACTALCWVTLDAGAQSLQSVLSRKVHGAGGPLDLVIDHTQPVTGSSLTVEPRSGTPGHLLVFQFDAAITDPGTAAAFDAVGAPVGMAAVAAMGNAIHVTLTGIPDNLRVRVALSNVNGAVNVEASLAFLVADFDGSRAVSSQDVGAVKARAGGSAGAGNFLFDTRATGVVAASDVATTKARVGRSLPQPGDVALSAGPGGSGTGSISSAPAGINCPAGACSANFTAGSMVSLTAAPGAGSTFGSWSGDCTGMATTVMLTLAGNTNCTAMFVANLYTVTPSAGPDGVISPATPQSVAHGSSAVFQVTANANFFASVGGTCGGSLAGNTFTTAPVTGACTVQANFMPTSHTVTPVASSGGTMTPSNPINVVHGNTAVFTITPSPGFVISSVGGTCEGTLNGTTYTTIPITGACAVAPVFVSAAAKYVSTTGNDTTGDGSIGNPWRTIGFGVSRIAGGDTLIVRNGTYTGKPNFITNVPSGTASRLTVIRAETPLEVRIQSTTSLNYNDNQMLITGNYVQVDGFIFDMAGSTYPPYIGSITGNYNKLTQSIFKRSGNIDAYGGLLEVYGNDNLMEDLAGVGACRYCFKSGGPSETTQRLVWRRIIGRFDYSNSQQPKATFSTYGNNNTSDVRDHLYQNVIAIDGQNPGTLGGPEQKYGGFYTPKRATNVRLQGCMVLNEGVGNAGMFLREFNSVNTATNTVIWDLPNSPSFADGIKINNASNLTIGGIIPDDALDITTGGAPGSLVMPAVAPANLLDNTPGAVILKRYGVSGTRWGEPGYDQLTTEDLWPWRHQDKIKSVFREVNNVPGGNSPGSNNTLRGFAASGTGLYGGPITLTSYIWEYLGTPCPSNICP